MTSETRTLLETGDITGIEMECEKCLVKSIFPVSSGLKITVYCPHCDKKWLDQTEDSRGDTVCPAANSLGAIGSHLWPLSSTRTDIHAKIRLFVNGDVVRISKYPTTT